MVCVIEWITSGSVDAGPAAAPVEPGTGGAPARSYPPSLVASLAIERRREASLRMLISETERADVDCCESCWRERRALRGVAAADADEMAEACERKVGAADDGMGGARKEARREYSASKAGDWARMRRSAGGGEVGRDGGPCRSDLVEAIEALLRLAGVLREVGSGGGPMRRTSLLLPLPSLATVDGAEGKNEDEPLLPMGDGVTGLDSSPSPRNAVAVAAEMSSSSSSWSPSSRSAGRRSA